MTPWLILTAVTLLAFADQHRARRHARARLAKAEAVWRLALAGMQADLAAERQHAAAARAEATEAALARDRMGETAERSGTILSRAAQRCAEHASERDAARAEADRLAQHAAGLERDMEHERSAHEESKKALTADVQELWQQVFRHATTMVEMRQRVRQLDRERDASTATIARLTAELAAARVRLARFERARGQRGRFVGREKAA